MTDHGRARLVVAALALALVAAASAPAHAEPRTHDGWYLRVGVGPGVAIGTLTTAPADSASAGINVATQLAIGWTVRPGLVLGGGTFPMVVPAPRYDGVDAGGQHVSATGAFVDYYPDPRAGLHGQAGVLFALGYLDGGDRDGQVGVGYGATVGLGYEVFIADEWSLGAIARATAYRLHGVDDTIALIAPALLVAVTRH